MKYEVNDFGFRWGPVTIHRISASDKKGGWVYLGLATKQHPDYGIRIYVTKKTGKVRIFKDGKELE